METAPRLVESLTPAIKRCGVCAEDITQDVLSVLVRRIGSFHHNGRLGAFRNWLRSTTVNVGRSHLRKHHAVIGAGDPEFRATLAQVAAPTSVASHDFDVQHNRHLIAFLLAEISRDGTLDA